VVWVLIEELGRDGRHIGGQPFLGPPTLLCALGRSKAAYEAIDGTPPAARIWPPRLPFGSDDRTSRPLQPRSRNVSAGQPKAERSTGVADADHVLAEHWAEACIAERHVDVTEQ
jgi:hypothetical protein